MICKNCANIFDDSFSCCPECGTPIKSNYDAEENAAEENPAVTNSQEKTTEERKKDKDTDNQDNYNLQELFPEGITPEEKDIPEEILHRSDEPLSEAEFQEEEEIIPERSEKRPPSRKEKSAMNTIVALMVSVFVLLGVLTAVGAFTDVFEESDDTVKTIALSGLSAEETKDLEIFLSDVGIVAEKDFRQGEDTLGEFVSKYLNPGNPGSLYSLKYGVKTPVTAQADPARRFSDENGEYSYFVAEESLVKVILDEFGFEFTSQLNEKDCYYYNGKFYFADSGESYSSSVRASVTSTIRSSDGTYYAKCKFTDESTSASFDTCVSFDKLVVGSEIRWEIIRLCRDTYIDTNGVIIEKDDGDFSYEIKTQVIENKDDKGKVIASARFEYPVFSGNSTAENNVNSLYENIIGSYIADPSLIKENITVTSRVAYNRNSRLSIVEETVTGSAKMGNVRDENGQVSEGLILPVKEVDGYILDTKTGENLSKSNIFVTDYQNVQFALYCIYSGFDMTAEDVPDDREELGKAIYSCSSAMCEEGYTFFYSENGFVQKVVIAYDTENFFAENYQ